MSAEIRFIAATMAAVILYKRSLIHTLCPARIVLETGTLSGWLARGLRTQGLPVDVIDARQAHAVLKPQHNKTDDNDAVLLAEIARTGFYRPASVCNEAEQKHRILVKALARKLAVIMHRMLVTGEALRWSQMEAAK